MKQSLMMLVCVGLSTSAFAQPRPQPPLVIPDPLLNTNFDPTDQNLDGATVRRIEDAADLAFQQIDALLRTVDANRRSIWGGTNAFYNANFGLFYDTSPANTLAGTYDQTFPAVRADPSNYSATDFDAATRTFNFADDDFIGNFRVGDRILIGGNGGTVFTITGIGLTPPDPMSRAHPKQRVTDDGMGGMGGGMGTMFELPTLQTITVAENIPGNLASLEVQRVRADLEVPNDEHWQTTLDTITEIRAALRGELNFFADLDIGAAQDAYDNVVVGGQTLDILFQQFNSLERIQGLSNSDSDEARAARIDPLLALLFWGEDNDAAGNPPREHFNSRLQAIADIEDDGVGGRLSAIVLGMAALTELETHVGGLFDGSERPDAPQATELLLFQMIIAGLAESPFTNAFFGMQEILDFFGFPQGDPLNPHPQNRDPLNYARAAADAAVAGGAVLQRPFGKNRTNFGTSNQIIRDDRSTVLVPAR